MPLQGLAIPKPERPENRTGDGNLEDRVSSERLLMGPVTFPLRDYLSQEILITWRNTMSMCSEIPFAIGSDLPEPYFRTSQ